MQRTTSLNGGATKPLKAASIQALEALELEPRPASQFNAGVRDRLTRRPDPLAEITEGPNPFKSTQKERPTADYLRLTAHGAAELARLRALPVVEVGTPLRLHEEGRPYGAVVKVTGASAEQIAQADDIAVSFAGTLRDANLPGRYLVREAREAVSTRTRSVTAERAAVVAKAARVAKAIRSAFGAAGGGR